MPGMITKAADREIERLLGLHPKGFDLSLDRITRLLERLDNPHKRLPPVIHVAGTNGKGSACAFSRALLEAAGLSVHVPTSPHLVNWHERYRLAAPGGGRLVEDEVLAAADLLVVDEVVRHELVVDVEVVRVPALVVEPLDEGPVLLGAHLRSGPRRCPARSLRRAPG